MKYPNLNTVTKTLSLSLFAAGLSLLLASCEQKSETEEAAEEIGDAVEESVEEVGDAVEDATE